MQYKKLMLFLSVAASVAMAQPLQVTVSADRTSLTVSEQLVLTVELSGDGANSVGQITLPDVGEYLSLLGSGGSSQSIQIINGGMSVQKSFTYFYQAVKEGTVTFPAISVNYKGNAYSSSPLVIQIGRGSAPAAGGAPSSSSLAPGDASDEDLFIRAAVSKRTVYPNEPVIITFRIYTRVNVASYGISKLADTGGFWAEDLTPQGQQPQTRQEVINGRKYVVADIKKMALFPTSPGGKTIGPMVLDCDVRMQNRRSNDIFDNFFDDPFFGRTVRRSIASKPISIEVTPFPEENRPANFSGLSGQFRLSASVDKQDVKTNEAITLKVAISGEGNIKTIPKPLVQLPADFEQYEPKVNENIQRQGDVVSGGKTFEYVLVPRFPGQQRIRPIQFSYFDASARQFRMLTTPEIAINVEKGSGDVATVPSGLSKEEVRFIGQDIRFIKLQSPHWRRTGYAFYRSGWFMLLTVLPLLALAGVFAYRRHLDKLSGNIAYARSRGANRMAMKRLAKAAHLCQEKAQKEFYAEVSRALTGFAADKLNVAQAGIISSELEKRLRERGLAEEPLRHYLELLQTCDFQRFAPADVAQSEMDAFLKKAKEAIINLEKSI